ncbi:unnamed protein product [Paramecium sonneborni]|uniref:Uncharacterized protein n=1 Tax=Paramecium sonneborni TaxID=65129 RepID=A0A8S1MXK0_9CILI|nr:unnamed protein product [Paramecium sonneborni]
MQDEEKILEQLKELDKAQDKNPHHQKLQNLLFITEITVVKLRTLNETTLKSENIKIYFCSLCGKKAIGKNIGLDTLPTRRSDIDIFKKVLQLIQNKSLYDYSQNRKVQNILSDQILKRVLFLSCVHVAYQCVSYEEDAELIQGNLNISLSNKPYLFVLNDTIVQINNLIKKNSKIKDIY